MIINELKSDDKIELIFLGEFNIYNLKVIQQKLLDSLELNIPVILNMGKATSFDSAGIQLLVAARESYLVRNVDFKIINHPLDLLRFLDIYGLIGYFGDHIKVSSSAKKELQLSYGLKKNIGIMRK